MSYFTRKTGRIIIVVGSVLIALCVVSARPLLSHARPDGVSVVITNNSSRGIRNVFFSPVDNDNWGDNQLTRVISPGQDVTVSAEDCSGSQIKVIAEDTDGCFITTVVSCGGNADWSVTNDSGRDCGS